MARGSDGIVKNYFRPNPRWRTAPDNSRI